MDVKDKHIFKYYNNRYFMITLLVMLFADWFIDNFLFKQIEMIMTVYFVIGLLRDTNDKKKNKVKAKHTTEG
ncbi:hypothetical protein JOC36_000783 [Weissella uvarum]|uniref:hypothetical protein n=1 Tax=Weissella uvarum TaxID=1479233 RepID=UPI0019607C6E|nr:hypothetical protein [Weissella uvarum]MBM7617234.1 hypothetical protein [Weissella uvarum]MCM0595527.1 hypothetical protein [Weissella uvarum]